MAMNGSGWDNFQIMTFLTRNFCVDGDEKMFDNEMKEKSREKV